MLFNIYPPPPSMLRSFSMVNFPPPPHVIEKSENLSLFRSSFIFLIHLQLRFFIALHPIR